MGGPKAPHGDIRIWHIDLRNIFPAVYRKYIAEFGVYTAAQLICFANIIQQSRVQIYGISPIFSRRDATRTIRAPVLLRTTITTARCVAKISDTGLTWFVEPAR